MNRQSGFTLIELIMVIIILGILAATALPRFFSLKEDAAVAALNGVAGALSSANTINYGVRSLHPASSGVAGSGVAVTNCTSLANAMEGGLPSGYAISAVAITAGETATCTLSSSSTTATATFSATGIE